MKRRVDRNKKNPLGEKRAQEKGEKNKTAKLKETNTLQDKPKAPGGQLYRGRKKSHKGGQLLGKMKGGKGVSWKGGGEKKNTRNQGPRIRITGKNAKVKDQLTP